jgi:hypothetical protein
MNSLKRSKGMENKKYLYKKVQNTYFLKKLEEDERMEKLI